MSKKSILAIFHINKDQMLRAESDVRDPDERTYYSYYEYTGDGSGRVKYSLRFYNIIAEGETFFIGLQVNSSFSVNGTLRIDDSGFDAEDDLSIKENEYSKEEEHNILSGTFADLFKYRDSVIISLELDVTLIPDKPSVIALPLPTAFDHTSDASHDTFDVVFVVGEEKIQAHRGFLSIISPVFQAMFAHHTKEAETGVVEIIDFDFVTVKNAMEYCYGQDTGVKTASEVIAIQRFADKYDIKTVIKRCDTALEAHVTPENFADIAEYAWTFDKPQLKSCCIELFRNACVNLTITPDFATLPVAVLQEIIQGAVAIQ